MAAVSGLCIHALYDISTTASDPLPRYAYVSPDAVYLRGEDATTFTFDGQQATYYEKETGLYDFHAR